MVCTLNHALVSCSGGKQAFASVSHSSSGAVYVNELNRMTACAAASLVALSGTVKAIIGDSTISDAVSLVGITSFSLAWVRWLRTA
jgi:hypothetical protein